MAEALLDLTRPGLDRIVEFSLLPDFYEAETARKNGGLDISSRQSIILSDREKISHYWRLLPTYFRSFQIKAEALQKPVDMYPEITSPSSAHVKNPAELENLALAAYQVSYANYVICSYNNLGKNFPEKCCGISTMNMLASLWKMGVPSASYAGNFTWDHGYVMIPFRSKNPRHEGVIIADPTSSQLWKNGPRNLVTIRKGARWQYMTDWKRHEDYDCQKNLFPDEVMDISLMRKSLKDAGSTLDIHDADFFQSGERYLKEAYKNPVRQPFLDRKC